MKKVILYAVLCALFFLYSGFLYLNVSDPPAAVAFSTVNAYEGKRLFQEKNCISCHQLYGLGGYMGPDLTNVISSNGKGEQYARAFLRNGTFRMPDFEFSEQEIDKLIAFLRLVDASGQYNPSSSEIEWTGWARNP